MKNREILFRAKKLGTDGWVYGLLHRSYASCDNIDMIQDIETGELEYINTTTVGQFTGLLDKNGVKIFEGDKVIPYFKNDNGHIPEYFWVVKYHDCYFYMESINRTPNVIETMFDFSNVIVIGTIHDHLLKGE